VDAIGGGTRTVGRTDSLVKTVASKNVHSREHLTFAFKQFQHVLVAPAKFEGRRTEGKLT